MSAPFLAEIRIFPYTFAPKNWAFCQGQMLSINQSIALFSIIGITFGGDGRTTFGLPNLQGNVPVGFGQGTGLSPYNVGQTGGAATVSLDQTSMASHTHPLTASTAAATSSSPSGAYYAEGNWINNGTNAAVDTYVSGSPTTAMRYDAVSTSGGSQPHNNMMPYLPLNFCICLLGVFPSRP